jgi:hypothetical protein
MVLILLGTRVVILNLDKVDIVWYSYVPFVIIIYTGINIYKRSTKKV